MLHPGESMPARVRVVCLLLVAVAAGCGKKSPTAPSITAPTPTSPANGAIVASASQPVTLTVTNGTVSSGTVTYTFEVATDAGFTAIVATKEVPAGSGQTSATLDTLAAGRDYYWHARANSGNTAGTFSTAVKFTIGSAVTLGAPVPVSPATGTTADQKPTLIVSNVSRSGPVSAVSYRFEIASAPSFATILSSGTVPEGSGSTSFTSTVELPADTTFYWRAQAVDPANGATSPYSTTQNFATIVSIDLSKVNYQRFVNISNWPVTNRLIGVDQDGGDGHMCLNHEKRGQWPTSFFEDNPLVPVEATQWYFARINGQWYGGAGEWLRPNQICKDGQKSEDIGKDGTWGGPMDTWIPKRGELVGYMISTPARAWPTWRTIDERSNVIVQPWQVNGISTP
jgi:hypothetical protein